jgi:hypothetical protein
MALDFRPSKSGHRRFVHSRGQLGGCLGGDALDSRWDRRGILEPGELGLPWALGVHVLRDILSHIAAPVPFLGPWTLGGHIAACPRHRVGTRPVRRHPASRTTRRPGSPRRAGLRLLTTGGIRAPSEARQRSSRVRGGQPRPESPPHAVGLRRTEAREPLARGERQRPRARGLRRRPWRQDLGLGAWRPPSRTALEPQAQSAFSRHAHHRPRWPGFGRDPPASPTVEPGRVGICGPARGPLPPPAALREPAAYRVRRPLKAVGGVERRRAGRPTPAGAAPALGPPGGVASGPQGSGPPRPPARRRPRAGAPPRWLPTEAAAPRALRPHEAGDAGAGAPQAGRPLRWLAARRTEQAEMKRPQRAIPCATEDGAPLGLLGWRQLQEGG